MISSTSMAIFVAAAMLFQGCAAVSSRTEPPYRLEVSATEQTGSDRDPDRKTAATVSQVHRGKALWAGNHSDLRGMQADDSDLGSTLKFR